MNRLIIFVTIYVAVLLTSNVQIAFAQPPDSIVVWKIPVILGTVDAQFTSDDRFIVVSGYYNIAVIETITGKVLRSINTASIRRMMKLSSDDSLIYTVGDDSLIYAHRLSDLSVYKIYAQMDNVFKHDSGVFRPHSVSEYFDITKDGKIIAINWENAGIGLYDLEKDSIIYHEQIKEKENGYHQAYSKVKFFQNDNKLAIGYYNNIRIYDTKTFKVERKIGNVTNGGIFDFDISPDEEKIVTVDSLSEVIIWDLKTGEKVYLLSIFCYYPIRFYDENLLWTQNSGYQVGIQIWNLTTKQISQNFPPSFGTLMNWSNKKEFTFIAGDPDPGYFYLINNSKTLLVYDKNENSIGVLHPNPVNNVINFEYEQNNNCELIFKISNIAGQIVQQGGLGFFPEGIQRLTIDASNLPNSIFFLSIISDNDVSTYKFVKGR